MWPKGTKVKRPGHSMIGIIVEAGLDENTKERFYRIVWEGDKSTTWGSSTFNWWYEAELMVANGITRAVERMK